MLRKIERALCPFFYVNGKMINLIGKDIEAYKTRNYSELEFFYDYKKKEIKDKRKMGHLTILDGDPKFSE